MHTYKLARGPIQWPNRCAACSNPASHKIESSCTMGTSLRYFIFFIQTSHLKFSIRYPVCEKHHVSSRVAGKISARNLFNLGAGVIWAMFAFALIVFTYEWLFTEVPPDPNLFITYTILVSAGIAIFWLAKRFTPVKLASATEDTLTISIQDDAYAREFESLNTSIHSL